MLIWFMHFVSFLNFVSSRFLVHSPIVKKKGFDLRSVANKIYYLRR